MSIKDKFLNKSNSFKFYKENYDKLKKNEVILKDEIDDLNRSIELLKKDWIIQMSLRDLI